MQLFRYSNKLLVLKCKVTVTIYIRTQRNNKVTVPFAHNSFRCFHAASELQFSSMVKLKQSGAGGRMWFG